MKKQTPPEFTQLFQLAEQFMREDVLPQLPPDGDPDPMLLVQLKPDLPPALIALPPLRSHEKASYALTMAAFVQALDPHAVAALMAIWLRSSTPNREGIMVSLANRNLTAMGMLFIRRNDNAPPTIEEVDPPWVADQESGRFAGLFDQDVSSLPASLLEDIRKNALSIREAVLNPAKHATTH